MPRELQQSELDFVVPKRLKDRPKYYDLTERKRIKISPEFEDWCILSPDLQKILQTLQQEVQGSGRDERTELLTEFVDDFVKALIGEHGDELQPPYSKGGVGQLAEQIKKINESLTALSANASTKQGTKTAGLEDAPEVKLVATDTALMGDELSKKFEEYQFLAEWLHYTVKQRWVLEGSIHDERKQRIQSWSEVLGRY